MDKTVLTLGDVVFDYMEIPDEIVFGSRQRLSEMPFIGDGRSVDAMGYDIEPIRWNGRFRGQDSSTRARRLEAMCRSGSDYVLSWAEFRYRVKVEQFRAPFLASFHIPYSIECRVIEDLASPASVASPAGVDSMLQTDGLKMTALSGSVGDSTLTGLVGTLNKAVSNVSSFAKAATATINGVLDPVRAVQSRVNSLIVSTGLTIENITTLGGVLPYSPIALNASQLVSQAAAMTQLPDLYALGSLSGRMERNLLSIGNSGKEVITTQNLYQAATAAYGDVNGWTTIARANGLTDPFTSGINTLRIPPTIDDTDGVLNP